MDAKMWNGNHMWCMPFNTHPAGPALPCLLCPTVWEMDMQCPLGMDCATCASVIGARHGHKEAMQENNGKLREANTGEQEMVIEALSTDAKMWYGMPFNQCPLSPVPPSLGPTSLASWR